MDVIEEPFDTKINCKDTLAVTNSFTNRFQRWYLVDGEYNVQL